MKREIGGHIGGEIVRTGNWDGLPIWRQRTAEEQLSLMLYKMGKIAPKNELQGSCICSDCDNSTLCEHLPEEPHQSVKGCSSCAR